MSGSMLGMILAKHGVNVLILDGEVHPRFAVGESTIPHTSLLQSILAEKYHIPEIDNLAYPDRIADHIAPTSGIKRAFGFCYQRAGRWYDHREGLSFGTSSKDENHLFRQDIDAYLYYAALRYGATGRQGVRVTGVAVDETGVRLTLTTGEELRAQYLVDGTGYKSVLADHFNLRQNPPALKHHSRTLFTHMVDVEPFEQASNPLTLSWAQTTLHHVFPRGWFWVIPFNNYERSTNPLISVGLTLDLQRHPRQPNLSPEEEFCAFMEPFPSVKRQFRHARAVRPWVSTGRLQYASRASAGYRWCLMSHAAGFIDPLFSRGLINTTEIIANLVDPLLAALNSGDFDQAAFDHLNRLQRQMLTYNDNLVHGAFISWDDFDLFNAWLRVWALGTILTEFRIMNALTDYTATRDERHLQGEAANPIFSNFEDPDYRAFFTRAVEVIESYDAGRLCAPDAAQHIFDLTQAYAFPVLIRHDAMHRAGWLRPGEEISPRNIQFARQGYRWAITNPQTRDLFGTAETFFRWRARQADPHVGGMR